VASTPAAAKKTVTVALLVAGGLVTVREAAAGRAPSVRVGLGLAVTGIALALIAEGAPGFAHGFALLLLVATVLTVGADTFDTLTERFNR